MKQEKKRGNMEENKSITLGVLLHFTAMSWVIALSSLHICFSLYRSVGFAHYSLLSGMHILV